MSKEICISTTPHETRLAILEDDELAEIYYERENEYTLAGSIYKGRVTRVLPGMQSAFVDIGLERDAFLYVTDFLEEQEDSDEFERTSLNGNQQRRENGRNRQPQSDQEAPQETAAATARDEESGDGEAPSGTRRWRGRRGRGRGMRRGRDNQDRDNRIQDQPVEAGSEEIRYGAPAVDVRIDETEATFEHEEPSSAPQPGGRIVLPGESLSKYGGAHAAQASQPQPASAPTFKPNYVAPKPTTLVETPITWDGSSLLPGESRARRRAPAQVLEERASAPEVHETAYETHQQEPQAYADSVEIPAATQAAIEAPLQVEEEIHESVTPDLAALRDQAEAFAEPEEHREVELHEEVHEFEPENASASHRIDISAPSEFRVSSVADTDVEEEAREEIPATGEVHSEAEAQGHDEQAAEVADQLFGFAPGAGILEEEVIDEEEYDFEPIHAHSDEQDSEDLEEETLERTGHELSDIVREEHLDQRLASEASIPEVEEAEADEESNEYGQVGLDEEDSYEGGPVAEEAAAEGAAPARERDRGDRRGRRGDRHGDRRGGRFGRRQGRGPHRASAQTQNLPIISDLLKQGQEILVQIAKEPIAKKGAR
ncbi:MAG TPA: hypothetical protein VMB19_06230, partial [Silvibacterium sp.]|nr:hypothetical protein [Silvibacterium sp.]